MANILSPYLQELVRQNGSDMYLTVGKPPSIRQGGNIIQLNNRPLQEGDLLKIVDALLGPEKKAEFEKDLELNVSIMEEDNTRFRLNFFYQQNRVGIVVRRINTEIPTIESLELPSVYSKLIMEKNGLILLASPGGSGKSTSMAAMLEYRNVNSSGHILTIEDPIEFIHQHKNCIFTQREVGTDTESFAAALKNALRQRADVIAIGEIRDRESMEHAIRFAETGHLCVATIHSNNTSQAIDRIVNFFPDESRRHVLATLSQTLLGIMTQRLVPNIEGGLSLAIEILLNEGLIKTLICDDRIKEIPEAVVRNYDVGMQSMDQALFKLYEAGVISLDVAVAESDSKSNFKILLNQKGLSAGKIAKENLMD